MNRAIEFALLFMINEVSSCGALPSWTMLHYAEAGNNLKRFALYNVREIARVPNCPHLSLFAQFSEPENIRKTWRYKMLGDKKKQEFSLAQPMGINPEKELIESVRWAWSHAPSDHFMLTLWNHGNGILDKPRDLRAILFNEIRHTYLTNAQLDQALKIITNDIIKKKIAVLGMDACLMGMIEVAYQIKDYADIFIASENIEPAPGWNYKDFLTKFINNKKGYTPKKLACKIVNSYLHNKENSFCYHTQSAIDLQKIERLTSNLDHIITLIEFCRKKDIKKINYALKQARNSSLEFDDNDFIDLRSFLDVLNTRIKSYRNDTFKNLSHAINQTTTSLDDAVLSKKNGRIYSRAGGLAIYFPKKTIHHSYATTKFAQHTKWLSFIQSILPLF